MKKFVYPAVIYYDEDALVYVMHIEDLGIVVEGDTVEEAHKRAGQFMDIYLETAFKEELDIPEATEFDKMVSAHPKEMVVLIESTLNDKNKAIKVDK
ncbi:MAG: type II toxin-antitoxin system HicB family antitoxin [Clostridia bacterium]|nr:type II toxin-antitoxin system HicB family antitoxin [Clostridia bacterium]